MRKIIIDTDCGSDDAVALMMALKATEIKVVAITTVCGNVPLHHATENALMCIEIADAQKPPVYAGASKPLFRDLVTAVNVHGNDGMGDADLIHPTIKAEKEHAVDALLHYAEMYPDELEIITIGPCTNIALAILKAPELMKKVKHIYSMGTAGLGLGNCTPVSEFNVYVDAEAYHILLTSEIPVTIIGFDICQGETMLNAQDIKQLKTSSSRTANFTVDCNRTLLQYNLDARQQACIDLPDAVAMGVYLWPDIVKEYKPVHAEVCYKEPLTYGQVVFNTGAKLAIQEGFMNQPINAILCTKIDELLYKQHLLTSLLS